MYPEKLHVHSRVRSNQGVQLTPLARLVGWARSTQQSATACWQHDNPQPPHASGVPIRPALQESAARALPGTCLLPPSSTVHTPASGAADARRSAAALAQPNQL